MDQMVGEPWLWCRGDSMAAHLTGTIQHNLTRKQSLTVFTECGLYKSIVALDIGTYTMEFLKHGDEVHRGVQGEQGYALRLMTNAGAR
ncbi:unnamed protein product [Dovyalis caffra]|uniref:Uncharacterized protein n=1 Tax=Dovyalis caffra TaxID=77055 RepID=A0AAV1SB39_9ROSI|nr:unnamed protein product [Dovyalis caffra]